MPAPEQGNKLDQPANISDMTKPPEMPGGGCIPFGCDPAVPSDQHEMQCWLTKIAATLPGVICSFKLRPDGSTCMPYASAALSDLYGLQPGEVQNDAAPIFARIHADDLGHIRETIDLSAREMTPWRDEFRVLHPTKGWRWIEGHSMPQKEPDESVVWHGFLQDVTERRQTQSAQRESEADLRRAQVVAQTGSWRLDVQRNELIWSDENHRIFGIPKGGPLTYETFLSTVHPQDKEFVSRSWLAALQGAPYDIEHRIVHGGETKWVRERAELEFNADGTLRGGFGSTQDINEKKRTEAALSASESRFRLAMEAVAGVVYDWDRHTGNTYWSSGLSRIFGFDELDSKLDRRWWHGNVHPDDLHRIRAEILRCLKARASHYELEYRMRHSAGHWVYVSDRAQILHDAADRVVRLVGSLTDISGRKSAEAALRQINDSLEELVTQRTSEAEARAQALVESERFARATIDALDSALCVLDSQGCIIAVNKAWREFAAENGGQMDLLCEGTNYLHVCDAADASFPVAATVASAIREALAGVRQDFSIEYDCHSPEVQRWFVMNVSCFPGGGALRLVIKHENITARKMAEEDQLESARRLKRLAEYLESIREEQSATIAREIHDELGGTLTMVKLGLATFAAGLADIGGRQESLGRILEQIDSALQTVKRISANLRPATLDTLGLIATIRWYATQFSEMTGIETELRLPEYVAVSKRQGISAFRIIQEALTNVAKHAHATSVCISMQRSKGQWSIKISDNGIGLSSNYQNKNDSIGLIGMHERAQYLGGKLSIGGCPGGGTCLNLRIPIDDHDEKR
jgi:PAS domain S-box-containing protein